MKKLLDNLRIFMATAMLISGSVFAQSNATDTTANEGYGTAVYTAKIVLYSGDKEIAERSETLSDRKLYVVSGTSDQDHNIAYHVELTPYLMTDGYVGVQIDSAITKKLPDNKVKASGKTYSFPVNTRCSVGATPKLELGKGLIVYGNSGLNVDDSKKPIPGCSMFLSITRK